MRAQDSMLLHLVPVGTVRDGLLLHGAVADGSLLIWGETGSPARQHVPQRRPRSASEPPVSPFGAGAEVLVASAKGGGLSITNVPVRQITLFLPSLDGRPLGSSPLIEAATERTSEASLAAWRVSALDLSAALAVEPFFDCQGKRLLSRGSLSRTILRSGRWRCAHRRAGGAARLPSRPGQG